MHQWLLILFFVCLDLEDNGFSTTFVTENKRL